MAELTIPLILDQALERGKCYVISGNTTALGIGEDVQVRIGNETQSTLLFLISGEGEFSEEFNYTHSSPFFQTVYFVIDTGADSDSDFDVTDVSLKLNPDCAQEYCSECFTLDNCGVAPTKEYLYLEWTNNDDGFGMNYTGVPLIHSLWIKGGLRNADYPYTEDYFTTSGGTHFPVYVDAVKTIELWVEDVPDYIHDALRLGVVHDEFTVNGVEYSKADGGYSPDWDTPNSLLAPVIVKLREKYQDTRNENC